ncbi:hypothetical protein HaLaN_01423 [Haematococcus lacustris]|uniref:Uncharacterized protein n=1 Tax=Haematococcus lacustris TaxID=44745 RepID=A0A699YUN6_HAELA|nr:hypothetical protein HaLaN_01423 [Haematococcus lacustris]
MVDDEVPHSPPAKGRGAALSQRTLPALNLGQPSFETYMIDETLGRNTNTPRVQAPTTSTYTFSSSEPCTRVSPRSDWVSKEQPETAACSSSPPVPQSLDFRYTMCSPSPISPGSLGEAMTEPTRGTIPQHSLQLPTSPATPQLSTLSLSDPHLSAEQNTPVPASAPADLPTVR